MLANASRPAPALFFALVLTSLLFLLSACNVPGVPATSARLPLVGPPPAATPLPALRLPQDEAPHRDLTEWWYYTGHLKASDTNGQSRNYGFELVVFQVLRSNYPPVYASHFAISDLTRGQFHYDQRRVIEPGALIPNGTSTSGFRIKVGSWALRGLDGQDHLQADMSGYSIDLDLHALKPPTLHNGNGLITYGPGGFSYYYSRTSLAVSGTLLDHQQLLRVTGGSAWMDHQWGNFLTLGGGSWDWYSIQLNNQTELMLYVIRDTRSQSVSLYAGVIGPTGSYLELPASALNINVLGHWTSPTTGITYPSGWNVQIDDVHLKTSLTLQPDLKDQELDATSSTGNVYWEGAVSILGSFTSQGQSHGLAVQGQGYVELTGYHR